jgi:hypothetical protein
VSEHHDHAAITSEWLPKCGACGYDLTGLPDGRCPERGGAFTWAELVAARDRPRGWSWRERLVADLGLAFGIWLSISTILFAPTLGITLHAWGYHGGSEDGYIIWITTLWVFAGTWYLAWLWARPSRAAGTLWILPPLVLTLPGAVLLNNDELGWVMRLEVVLGLAMLSWPARRELAKTLWAVGAVVALAAIPLGAAYAVTGIAGRTRGEWWSLWADPRPGQIYDQYPLTNSESACAGFFLLAVGLLSAMLLAWAWPRVWRRRASDA